MRKKCFYAAALAMMLASCSQELETPQLQVQEGKPAIAGETPIGFNVYTNRPITRAGITGDLSTDRLKDLNNEDGKPGFGVFAYYTDNLDYTCQTKPNFMYNQQVQAMDEETWTYEPVKYWPNEFGDAAQSKDQDKVSFFAYAPYVECDPATGKLIDDADTDDVDESTLDTYGITGFSKNTFAGDPYVKYIASFDMSKAVDLCYGTVANGYEQWQILNGGVQDLEAGLPYLSVEHPAKLDQKMKFNFKHALAQLNVKIDVDADVNSHAGGNGAADGTKVYVRSISFKGFAMKGALNLNNTEYDKARWMHYNGQGLLSAADAETFLVNDGRKNGKEGTTAAASEKYAFLNQTIISNDGNTTPGVTGDQVNLFKLDLSEAADPENPTDEEITAAQAAQLNNSVYVIPVDADEPMSVTIVYDVETSDDKLASLLSDGTKGSRVRNEITKEISFNGGGLKSGYKHTINLHLGLNSVKFDAEVSGWQANGGNANAWLPITENPGEGTFNPGNSLKITSINGGAPAEDMSGSNAVKAAINGIMKNSALNTMSVESESGDESTEWMIENTQVAAIKAGDAAPSRAGTRNEVPEGYAATATGKSVTIAPVASGTTILHSTYKGKESTIVITVIAPTMNLSASSATVYAFADDNKAKKIKVSYNVPSIYVGELPNVSVDFAGFESLIDVTTSDVEGGKEISISPVVGAAGTAQIKVTDSDGNEKTINVKVKKPTLSVNKAALSLMKGKEDATIKFTATPSATFEAPEDENGYQLQCTLSEGAPFTFEDGVIKASSELVADAEGTMTVQFVGHTGDNDPKVVVTVNVLATDITTMKANAQSANPLWKVAQYNVAPSGSSFVNKHSTTSQFVFTWADAQNVSIDGYHLPSAAEQVAIIPSHNSGGNGTNIFGQNNGAFVYPATNASGEFAEASGKGGQFVQNGVANDIYACRKLNGNLTAWHYKYVTSPCNGILIESYVLESTDDSPENMAKIASALAASDVWSSAEANEKPESVSETSSLVTRFLPFCGITNVGSGSGVASTSVGSSGFYWSVTSSGANAFFWVIGSGALYDGLLPQGYGFSVRLFHD